MMIHKTQLIGATLLFCQCAHHQASDPGGQQTADAGYIRFEAPMNHDESTPQDQGRFEALRQQLFTLDSEISNRRAQIAHFRLLENNLWDNQIHALESEIRQLKERKFQLEAQLNDL